MPAFSEIAGLKFGRLTAVRRLPREPGSRSQTRWVCSCECGAEATVTLGDLKSGKTSSCGCRRAAVSKTRMTTHGATANGQWTGTYTTWAGMKQRCQSPNDNNYPYYGGRGIRVCERWQTFENFLADMGERPPGMSIDRINPNGDYEPGNCQWANGTRQSRNRSMCKLDPESVNEIRGRHEHGESMASIARRLHISSGLVYSVVNRLSWADVP